MQELIEWGGLEEIEAFVAVAELGGFAAAAHRIGRDASIVSRRVSLLEKRLGVRLLARTTRRVSLTEAGGTYLTRVRVVLEELAFANQEVSERAAHPRGLLRVSVPNVFGRMWVAPILPRFLALHPQIRADVRYSDRFVDLVADGFDIAVRVGVLRSSTLISKKLAEHRALLCASPRFLAAHGTPRSPAELTDMPCLGYTGYSFWPDWPLQKAGRRKTVRPQGPLITDNTEAALVAAIEGAGIVLTADWLAGPALRSGKLIEVLPGWTVKGDFGIYAVMPPGRLVPAKTRAFVDFLSAAIKGAWSAVPRAK
jgi:DNA-binding transcriptional LysR family regulator